MDITLVAVGYQGNSINDVIFKDLRRVKVYEINSEGVRALEERSLPKPSEFPANNQHLCAGRNDDYVNAVADILTDCKFLLLKEIGGYPSRVFLRRGIQTLEQEGETEELLEKIRNYLRKDSNAIS